MSIELFNINSPYNVREKTLQFVISRAGFLLNLGKSVPVYLVDKDLMDSICPPQIRRLLEPGCVQDMMRSFDEEYGTTVTVAEGGQGLWDGNESPESMAAVAEKFWLLMEQCARGSVAVSFRAVYFRSIGRREAEEIERRVRIRIPFTASIGENGSSNPIVLANVPTLGDLASYKKIFGRLGKTTADPIMAAIQVIIDQHGQAVPRNDAIFICMERIVQSARRLKETWAYRLIELEKIIEILFAANVLHQLAHAYMKTEPSRYYTPWGRVMEESLVTAYVMSCFDDDLCRAVIKSHLAREPLEYQCFSYYESVRRHELKRLLQAWSRNNVRKGLKLSLSRELTFLPRRLYDHVFYQHASFFSHQPDTFWKIMAMEVLREAVSG